MRSCRSSEFKFFNPYRAATKDKHEPGANTTRSSKEGARTSINRPGAWLRRRACRIQHTARRHPACERRRGHERLLEQPAAQSLQLQRLSYEGLGTGQEESRELVSRDQRREARGARCVSDNAWTNRRGRYVPVEAVADLQRRARDCFRPDDARVQTHRQRLESDSPALINRHAKPCL